MDWIYLVIITPLGATIQSATGFGLIAVPVFLYILDSTDAIQMVMIVILCMSILDWFKLRGQVSPKLLLWMSLGLIIGFPMGLIVFQEFDLGVIKPIIAFIILFFSLYSLLQLFNKTPFELKRVEQTKNWKTLLVGFVSEQ